MSPEASFANMWWPDRPYNALPRLPPATELESRAVLKQCVLSRSALAALKQAAALIPNQIMLINTIPLLEAKDSSEIENIVTTADKLFQFAQAHDGAADPATKEALRCRTASYAGMESLVHRPLCTATAVDICRTIKASEMDVRRVPGSQLVNAATGRGDARGCSGALVTLHAEGGQRRERRAELRRTDHMTTGGVRPP